MRFACPDHRACGPQWNAYTAAGPTLKDRRERLAECPEHLRASVMAHVETVFKIRARRAE